jgi:hypothetical protein
VLLDQPAPLGFGSALNSAKVRDLWLAARQPHRGPLPLPPKGAICRAKDCGVHDARPLGAGMDSSASGHESTPTTGAWPSPASCAAADSGVHDGDHGPLAAPLESAVLQGKTSKVHDARPLSRNGLVCLLRATKVLPQRGHGLRRLVARLRTRGSELAIMAPPAAPKKPGFAGKKAGGP